jgi:hypothetical protein
MIVRVCELLIAEPDRACHEDHVGRHDQALVDVGEVIALVAVLTHVGPHPRRDHVVDGADLVDPNAGE